MFFRPWNVRLFPWFALLWAIMAIFCLAKSDSFYRELAFPAYISFAAIFIAVWSTAYTVMAEDHLLQQKLFWKKFIPYHEIHCVKPHRWSRRRFNGTHIQVICANGRSTVLSPPDSAPVLEFLRHKAPQAEFRF